MNLNVDIYVQRSEKWPEEMIDLRAILLGCGLIEEIKWGKPCTATAAGTSSSCRR